MVATDKIKSNSQLKRHRRTSSDALHRLYLPTSLGGQGFLSLLDQDIVSVARELEVVSNLSTLDGNAFRMRLEAICFYNMEDESAIINHARVAIRKLARYGIFLQNKQDDIINNVISELNLQEGFASIGCPAFEVGNSCSLGAGKPSNIDLSYGKKNLEY